MSEQARRRIAARADLLLVVAAAAGLRIAVFAVAASSPQRFWSLDDREYLAVADHLRAKYRESYGRMDEAVPEIVGWATGLALENIARSDATYHDVQHTALVVQCGAELLRCRSLAAETDDAACREAWEVNRRRFMGESRSYIPPATANDTGER